MDKLLKIIRDNYSRQLFLSRHTARTICSFSRTTIREYILFGLEECAKHIGNSQQNDVF